MELPIPLVIVKKSLVPANAGIVAERIMDSSWIGFTLQYRAIPMAQAPAIAAAVQMRLIVAELLSTLHA
jgi:hypothetical protein